MIRTRLPDPVTRVIHVEVDPDDPAVMAELDIALNAMFNPQPDPGPRLARLLEETRELLPPRLKHDRYWLSCLLIFKALFPALISDYFDFEREKVDILRFNREMIGLSHGEDVLVSLAFHLFNDSNRLPRDGLTSLRVLDKFHFELAMLAIRLAHGN